VEYYNWYAELDYKVGSVFQGIHKNDFQKPTENVKLCVLAGDTLCSEKNAHSHFISYLHELWVDLNKNSNEYTQGMIDSDNVEIRYSLRPMT